MNKKLQNGVELFDGEPVEIYEGRFSGSFWMNPETAAPLCHDELVTFLVTARVDAPKFTYVKKTGELKRANTMKVQSSFVVDPAETKYLFDNMGFSVEGINSGLIETTEQEATPSLLDWNTDE
jgi:hypothetical protein